MNLFNCFFFLFELNLYFNCTVWLITYTFIALKNLISLQKTATYLFFKFFCLMIVLKVKILYYFFKITYFERIHIVFLKDNF